MPSTLAEIFQALWDSTGSPPDVFAFLEQYPDAEEGAKLAVLRCDQKHRWKTDHPLKVEEYLARLSDLAANSHYKIELAVGEFQARQNGSTSPSIEEFASRFHDISETLRKKLSESDTSKENAVKPEQVGLATETLSLDSTLNDQRIGRYRLLRILGEGAFGRVWLGYDDDLERQVAIKVPKPERFHSAEDAELYLAEARMVAALDHPNIVPVHDVGRTEEGSVYVVSKFIEGNDLKKLIEQDRPSSDVAAQLLAVVARALHHAHQKRLIHRDIKPANILIEEATNTPFVADFGLAIKEEDYLKSGSHAGTPAYMSPEQARGEGHRLDGRSDIFSVGIVFYELLTGKRPFLGSTSYELMVQISTTEPQPPRERDASIPAELERICLKSLSKRVSDRYATAADLADDLLHWNQSPQQEHKELQIVPKGLRSFDAEDSDFFLDLLPGPRSREGLPESISFWKARMEESDPDKTFAVGLIYGPSGCGKSSLVKAGLLPRLSKDVVAIYIEATPDETETRILRGLRKQLPDLPDELGLVETFMGLRRESSRKVVIVLDQFEQWLHAHRSEQDTQLVTALRQCDGEHLQAVVMVRDDFAMAASRFMRELDTRILEGHNFSTVDLFDVDHAEKVLTKFGQAFGKLPAQTSKLSDEETAFVATVAEGLAQEGKVISVRLALFAEMVKGKPWSPKTLQDVGGTEGIGINFLEETFSSRDANPEHRLHQQAAREVLKCLLPEVGSDIKGHMRSHAELLETSGYKNRPKDFEELLRILDGELRLITPTDPEGFQSESDSDPNTKYYQLTHDYLVPSLREWLNRKQKETKKGRAELRLAERSALWNSKPGSRHLPSWWEWFTIRRLTEKKKWTKPEYRMMHRAGRFHQVRGAMLAGLLILLTFAGVYIRGQVLAANHEGRVNGFVQALVNAEIGQVPAILKEMQDYRQWVEPKLAAELEQHDVHSTERLNLSLALLPGDPGQLEYLKNRLIHAEANQVETIRSLLADHKDELLPDLWRVVQSPANREATQLLPAASALALYDPDNKIHWSLLGRKAVEALVNENPLRVAVWIETLRPARHHLLEPLTEIYRNEAKNRSQTQIDLATSVLEDYAADEVTTLAELIFEAQPKQFVALYDEFAAQGNKALALVDAELQRKAASWKDSPLDSTWTKLTGEVTQTIQQAQGLVTDRFAFCQTLPLEELAPLTEKLRKSGYRPLRLRPYAHNGSVQVAAAWTRDGRDFRLMTGQSVEAIQKVDEEQRLAGFTVVDVAGYIGQAEGKPAELYAGVWVKQTHSSEEARIYAGVAHADHKSVDGALQDQGFRFHHSLQGYRGLDGEQKYCGVKTKSKDKSSSSWNQTPAALEAKSYSDKIAWDIDVSHAAKPTTTKQRNEKALADAEAKLREKPDYLSIRYARAKAHFYLGQDEQALEDLNFLIEKVPQGPPAYQYRAILYARTGQIEEAKNDLAKFEELGNSTNTKVYLDAVVSAYLGEDAESMKRLEPFIKENENDAGSLYDAACAYSIASKVFEGKDAAKSKVFANRAVALIRQAIENGYNNYSHMEDNSDLDPIREHPDFQKIIQGGNLDVRYAVVWNPSTKFESQESHGLSAAKHLVRCHELQSQGYRMVSVSTASINGELVTASVWHRPLFSESEKETFARRQGNAAVAILRMGQAEKVWPLLKHSPDPRLRTWIIHRLSPMGASPQAIVKRLEEESDVTIRRALILALGEYYDAAAVDRDALSKQLLDWYKTDPDAGIHGATEWVLRHGGKQQEIAAIDKALQQSEDELRAKKEDEDERQWYINTQGQTFVVLEADEFLMGSPASEPDRDYDEKLHRRKIRRRIAICTKEVSKSQWRIFSESNPGVWPTDLKQQSAAPRTEDSPITRISWFQAAYYCNWLSEKEGIPPDQWCYETNTQGNYKYGMRAKEGFWKLNGYRLPTEAEWEYACRAKSLTSRYYGMSETLLPKYAWFLVNGENRPWPTASLKPNDFGLFDMLGNVTEWCQDGPHNYPPDGFVITPNAGIIAVGRILALRGGSFMSDAAYIRSANRAWEPPSDFKSNYGFRPVKTFPHRH